MKFSTTQLLAALGFASYAAADFHILTGPCSIAPGWGGSLEDYAVACPSNYYNCKCMMDGDRTGHVINGETPKYGIHDTGSNYFELDGMCGVGNMNFYLQGDGTWLFYIAGGDGSVQGQCWPGDNSIKDCNEFSAACSLSNILVCYSYICEP
ncbi:hypothetical protein TsFJ059_005567 [Trichoderma semiorbis]|uniref:MRSP1/expansin-like protein n=3 Tax=Trichoderma TaxID=5543 RepID=A0A2T4ABQ6_TRIHA|nr:hypothetical protein M431DRAFT_142486 [Trichoderma harzianum CBS 226.95]KAH0531004.1 hypothetical protein TsFJ059_005567 [Trichoderma semiorbis]KAK0762671.1 hypothetical protein N5P37_005489 [Trichoderma harzianum]OPB43872.1 MRSP1/expansin-like protein [Trichoderma guizhouense]PKK53630.1 hypothetical protein CI102_995 [Trichoderma harzianum]PTB54524.1 hypothetical protein M431DRAFT_142486 [Trichoderma harzianum CBS 226.95]